MVAMAVGSHTIYCLFKALVRFSMLAYCAGGRLGRADGILAVVPAQSPLGCTACRLATYRWRLRRAAW
jgi:hypothetical protein